MTRNQKYQKERAGTNQTRLALTANWAKLNLKFAETIRYNQQRDRQHKRLQLI